jgi:hypothetical protein
MASISRLPVRAEILAPRLLLALVVVDVLLLAVNVIGAPSFLDLDQERNFPTWYSSAKLLGASMAALWCWRLEPAERRRGTSGLFWPIAAVLFALLSMDETATAHERFAALLMSGAAGMSLRNRLLGGDQLKDAFVWPVLLAPLALAIFGFLLYLLWERMRDNRRSLVLGFLGCAAFILAMMLEGPAVYTSPPIAAWGAAEVARYRLFILVEEGAELAGTTLMLAALLLHGAWLAKVPKGEGDGTGS